MPAERTIAMLDLRKQLEPLRQELVRAAEETIDSGWYLLGDRTSEFERSFARWLGSNHAAACANGTDAITLALWALGVGAGDDVITVPNTAFPTACAIAQAGASPVFVDIDPRTWLMDPDRVAAALTPRTKAVVPVHLFGNLVDVHALQAVLPAGVGIVEDCAQAHGALLRGIPAGRLGVIAAFSFYPSKNLGALGDGGLVVTGSADLDRAVRQVRFYGQQERDHHTHIGMNSRLDEIQAAFLSAALHYFDRWVARRRRIASIYDTALRGAGFKLPDIVADSAPAYHLYVVQVPDRDGFRRHLADNGIQTGVHYPVPIPFQPAFSHLSHRRGDFPHAEHLADHIVSLPVAPHLTDEEVSRVVDVCLEYRGRK